MFPWLIGLLVVCCKLAAAAAVISAARFSQPTTDSVGEPAQPWGERSAHTPDLQPALEQSRAG